MGYALGMCPGGIAFRGGVKISEKSVELGNTLQRAEFRHPSFPYKPAVYVVFSILVRTSPITELSGLRTSVSSGSCFPIHLCHSVGLNDIIIAFHDLA